MRNPGVAHLLESPYRYGARGYHAEGELLKAIGKSKVRDVANIVANISKRM
jgi:hypothetical protein